MVGMIRLQELGLPEDVPAGQSHLPLRVGRIPGRDPESHGNHRFELEDVGDVVNERLRLAGVDEADRRGVPRRQDGGLADAVQAGGGGREAAVRHITTPPLRGVVVARVPTHTVLAGEKFVHLPHAHPFDAAKLLHTAAFGRLLLEAQRIHLAYDFQSRRVIQGQLRLIEKPVGPRPSRLARGVEPDARLAHPDEEAPDPGR